MYRCDFLFLAANIDAVSTASRFGISADRGVNYRTDKKGTRVICDAVVEIVRNYYCARPPVTVDWIASLIERID